MRKIKKKPPKKSSQAASKPVPKKKDVRFCGPEPLPYNFSARGIITSSFLSEVTNRKEDGKEAADFAYQDPESRLYWRKVR